MVTLSPGGRVRGSRKMLNLPPSLVSVSSCSVLWKLCPVSSSCCSSCWSSPASVSQSCPYERPFLLELGTTFAKFEVV